ncbi:serine-rich adhesin for platelets [Eurosta solidaginis]|uniref:serine-rich adhesin for platelets n=1 Tax=Eurosta solidaginis TaxID=178769 RepID=UPI0035313806
MTTETYLDVTFDRSGKSGKRPLRPKLLKLTDVTMPHRSRKKTKVKTKERSVSSVRDRIYDDPAYTDDISHLANPIRRNSCSSKADGSSSLDKRSKLSKEFLQQNKPRDAGASYNRDISSSSDEPQRSDSHSKSVSATGSMGRRGRSLERSAASARVTKSTERKREKRERSNKHKSESCTANTLHPDIQMQQNICADTTCALSNSSNRRTRSAQPTVIIKQYSDGAAADLEWMTERAREDGASVRSSASTAKVAAKSTPISAAPSPGGSSSKMQIGRRLLRGEIGIKSFNYYLLKEGIKTSKRFVEKQRNTLASGLAGAAGVSKKSHSRSEENIYEEIFFKGEPVPPQRVQLKPRQTQTPVHSQPELKYQPTQSQQLKSTLLPEAPKHLQQQLRAQHTQRRQSFSRDVPLSQRSGSEEGMCADCEFCEQCDKENCDYCYAQQVKSTSEEQRARRGGPSDLINPYAVVPVKTQPTHLEQKMPEPQHDWFGRPLVTQASSSPVGSSALEMTKVHDNAAQVFDMHSGVFKVDTTTMATTTDYSSAMHMQQSSSSTGTATTTPSGEPQPQQKLQMGNEHHAHFSQYQQQPHSVQQIGYQSTQLQKQQIKHSAQSNLLQSSGAALHHRYHPMPSGITATTTGTHIPHQRARGSNHSGANQPQQSHYMRTYNAHTIMAGAQQITGGVNRMQTKSSSSSDSLQQHHLHKHSTVTRLDAQHGVMMSDPFYGGANMSVAQPLMFAASRPIGGSQILMDFKDLPQIYKSDSRASILSEYSLRSSDNSHRYNRFRYALGGGGGSFSGAAGGGGQVSDSSLGDSLLSCTSAQRRYFGSSESCRFGFECRRCSLDGGEKCSYSDTCRYECRNCDCSSSYFSSDFDELYGTVAGSGGRTAAALAAQRSSGIPRKTAAGTLPASGDNSEFERQQDQLDLKQNKYAQDFFKHVNDVKRSIYQSEMQHNVSEQEDCTSKSVGDAKIDSHHTRIKHNNDVAPRAELSPKHQASMKEEPEITTLPLTKERSRTPRAISSQTESSVTPTPAPRTSLKQPAESGAETPQPTQRSDNVHSHSHTIAYERQSEYPSLDRLLANATGAIPKTTTAAISNGNGKTHKNNATNIVAQQTSDGGDGVNNKAERRAERHSPRSSPQSLKITDRPLGLSEPTLTQSTEVDMVKASTRETRVAAETPANNNNNIITNTTVKSHSNVLEKASGTSAPLSAASSSKREPRYLTVDPSGRAHGSKRHHRTTSVSKQASASLTRRSKDIPAPPPPSPAAYSDLQELKVNLEHAQQQLGDGNEIDAKKSSAESKKKKQQQIRKEEDQRSMVQDETDQLALKPKKERRYSAQQSPIRDSNESVDASGEKESVKSPKSQNSNALATPAESNENAIEIAKATTKNMSNTCGMAAGANCMPDAIVVMQQKQEPRRLHAKLNNANSSSKNSLESVVEQQETNNSAHATDDDDVFYDARSEDSGGTAFSAASSSLIRQHAVAAASKSENEQQRVQHDGMIAMSPEFKQTKHNKGTQQTQQNTAIGNETALNIGSEDVMQYVPANNDEDNATTVQIKSKHTLAANSESIKAKRTKNATSQSRNEAAKAAKSAIPAEDDVINVGVNGATGSSPMALNLVEAAVPTKVGTALASEEQQKNVVISGGDGEGGDGYDGGKGGLSISSGTHSRREKKRSGSSRGESASKQQASTPTTTISCDTCCQMEREQYQQQQQEQQQQKTNSSRHHDSWVESKQSKTSKERANKIKDGKSKELNETITTTMKVNESADIVQKQSTTKLAMTKTIDLGNLTDFKTCAVNAAPEMRADKADESHTQQNEHAAEATVTTITITSPTAESVVLATTNAIVNEIGAQSDNKEITSNEAVIICSAKNSSAQHVAVPAEHNVNAATELSTTEQNEAVETAKASDGGLTKSYVATTQKVTAKIIITPAEPTITTPTTVTDTTDAATAPGGTVSAKLLTEAEATTITSAASITDATATELTSLSLATSVTNSTVSCISYIAGVTTPSYSPANVSTISTTIHDKQNLDHLSRNKPAREHLKRPPLNRQDCSICVDSSEAQSDDSRLTRDSVTRESQNDELSSSTLDKLDVSTLPLPALPPKKRRGRLRASPSRHHSNNNRRGHDNELACVIDDNSDIQYTADSSEYLSTHSLVSGLPGIGAGVGCDYSGGASIGSGGSCHETKTHLSAFQLYKAKRRESLEASTRSFNEKLESRRMHYHIGGGSGCESGVGSNLGGGPVAGRSAHMPTYQFGEQYHGMPTKVTAGSTRKGTHGNKEEIFLNKSGWVQVNTKRNSDGNRCASAYLGANYKHQNGGGGGSRAADFADPRIQQIEKIRRSDRARMAIQKSYQQSLGHAFYSMSGNDENLQYNATRASNAPTYVMTRDNALRPGYRIVDPQLASILNERPGFLPVRNMHDADSPPPITPILSPPPAFQDSSKSKYFDRRKTIPSRQQQTSLTADNLHKSNINGSGAIKGMVFSRSFECDTRRKVPADTYVETFSRSFDGNLSERPPPLPLQRERSPNFSSLTGNSPNYLSKKDSGGGSSGSLRSRDNSPKYQHPQTTAYLNASIKEAPPAYSAASATTNLGAASSRYSPRSRHDRSFERSKSQNIPLRSKKSQFNRAGSGGTIVGGSMGNHQTTVSVGMSRFRSFDTAASQRLNSCDSGARSDLSNDELDCEDDEGSNEFLTANYHHSISPLKTQRQRSLTPDRNESHSSSSSIRKQRSLTPESRSLTPEDRRRKVGSQGSLMGSRQNSSSRSNTLERKQRLTDGQSVTNISRSSSSSSYSGGGGMGEHETTIVAGVGSSGTTLSTPNMISVVGAGGGGTVMLGGGGGRSQHRRSLGRNAKQVEEHRIRRSRSLQLSERSPNRTHKVIVTMGQSQGTGVPYHTTNAQPIYQQSSVRISNGGAAKVRPPIRTTSKSQSLVVTSNNGRSRNNDIDKSRSFDFDYNNYNNQGKAHVNVSSNALISGNNPNVPLRLDFDKSRSLDDDYREPVNCISIGNNLVTANGMRYLQANADSGASISKTGRLRRSSPVGTGSGDRNSRSPQSSGSSCNNLNLPRQSTSPQSYGTRLCDHELTYDILRRSLDRSPIMDFRRGDSGDYDIPPTHLRNREIINSGGNSELNFFNNDTTTHIYEQPTKLVKQQRSLGHTHSPSESQYSLERQHGSGSGRESLTPEGDYRSGSEHIYRHPHSREGSRDGTRGSGGSASCSNRNSQIFTISKTPIITTNSTSSKPTTPKPIKSALKRQGALIKSPTNTCSFWPQCGACNPSAIISTSPQSTLQQRQWSLPVTQQLSLQRQNSTRSPNTAVASVSFDQIERDKMYATHKPMNISTISVNSNNNNINKSTILLKKAKRSSVSDSVVKSKNQSKLAGVTRTKTQWTLLCSGASLMDSIEESAASSPASVRKVQVADNKNDTLTSIVAATGMIAVKATSSLPLPGDSTIFFGECEMPITRECEVRKKYARELERGLQSAREWEKEQKRAREREAEKKRTQEWEEKQKRARKWEEEQKLEEEWEEEQPREREWEEEQNREKELELEREQQLERKVKFERQLGQEREKKLSLEYERALEREREWEEEQNREKVLEWEHEQELEWEREQELEWEREIELEWEREQELEREREQQQEGALKLKKQLEQKRELELALENERALERERKYLLSYDKWNSTESAYNRTITGIRNNDIYNVNTHNGGYYSNYSDKQPSTVAIKSKMVANRSKTSEYCTPQTPPPTAAIAVKVMDKTTKATASTSTFAKNAKPLPTRAKLTTATTSTAASFECGSPILDERDWRSTSLPNVLLLSHGSPKATNPNALPQFDDVKSSYSTNLSQQMRAVSSPSLTDTLQAEKENIAATSAIISQTALTHSSCASGESTPTMVTATSNPSYDNSNRSMGLPNSQSVGVLQKFKRTLTNFSKPAQQQQQHQQHITTSNGTQTLALSGHTITATTSNTAEADDDTHSEATTNLMLEGTTGKYRFGPLIWRSSKERRKTKYNRRDKCNSGDSGIQIELDNDEQFSRILVTANCGGVSGGGSGSMTSTSAAAATQRNANDKNKLKMRSVRRVNSAKAASMTDKSATLNVKGKMLKRMEIYGGSMEREAPESLPARSLSQPNGLDTCGIGRAGELDDSDSDSVTSHEEATNSYPLYAEVLYSFTAAGPQELGLERGTLIEVLRKEVGPWWFGRIRKEENNTLVEEILDPELGWFPKEFVRVIQSPKTDVFFLSQMANTAISAGQTLTATVKSSVGEKVIKAKNLASNKGARSALTPKAPIVSLEDLDATIVDENNVTTIVIESPSYLSLANAPGNSSSSTKGSGSGSNGGGVEASNALTPSRSINVIPDSADILRRNAVKELLDTEVNYVKLLASICEGYLPAMSKRIDIFSPNSIRLIFSNITAIYKFQRKFLEALRKGIEQNQVAKVFLKMHKGFLCYSTYCNAYPRALIELETYDRVKDARTILENCRESENLAELPLSAHLLAPVQRICRYPLHLSEILKGANKSGEAPEYELAQYEQFDVSQMEIPDTYEKIDLALEAMRGITEAVNEGKRHSETIARHQASFQNFKGPPLHLHSTRFFLQIDATRQKQNLWNSSCTLFLFDNQLIYCKRDIIKRSQFIYKGRIFLDRCRVVNVRDGKMFGHTIRNSLRIYCEARDKWYDFSFRSANRKHRFLSTLALERQFGGKAFYVAEMTGFEYAYDERDYSDQSDYEMPDCEHSNSSGGGGVGVGSLGGTTRHWSMADVSTANVAGGGGTSATSGDSSVPESPVKYKYSDTLPKKSQTRDTNGTSGALSEGQTGSLGRRRLGNWFRKPKSSHSTPNHSPTHKANDIATGLVGGSENNISINVGSDGNYNSSGSSA